MTEDGSRFMVNKIMFAINSSYGKDFALDTEEAMSILTGLAAKDVQIVADYLRSGCIPFASSSSTLKAFTTLGISLPGKNFYKVSKIKVVVIVLVR